jgi:hypothetical protein
MRLLELFSGTGSIGTVFKEYGWEVVSLDRDMPADISTDIMDWDYKGSPYPPKHFDVIWASPPCTEYSRSKTAGVRKLDQANAVVERTLEILNHFQPTIYFIENPQTGLLKNQPFMDELPYNDVDYCKYGMPYRKRTRLWNNCLHFLPKICRNDCDAMDDTKKKHKQVAQQSPQGAKVQWGDRRKFKRDELYMVPRPLVEEILLAVTKDLIE